MNTYKQGYDKHSTATHEKRTAESDAAFLLPHIKPTDHILDVGCGPGTITTSFARYATAGDITGIDLSPEVLAKATTLASEAGITANSTPPVIFQQANVLEKLPFEDNTFDIVYASQVLGHMPLPDFPVQALTEMRRVLKPNGILASRDGLDPQSFPHHLDLQKKFFEKQWYVLQKRRPGDESVASSMPALLRRAGFDVDGGKTTLSSSGSVLQTPEEREWVAKRMEGMLATGSATYKNWLAAGIDEASIAEGLQAIRKWAETPDAWFLSAQLDTLAFK